VRVRIWSKEGRKKERVGEINNETWNAKKKKKSVGTKIKEEVMKEYGNKEINEKIEEQSEARRKEFRNEERKQTK
jgi:hypothetical protein